MITCSYSVFLVFGTNTRWWYIIMSSPSSLRRRVNRHARDMHDSRLVFPVRHGHNGPRSHSIGNVDATTDALLYSRYIFKIERSLPSEISRFSIEVFFLQALHEGISCSKVFQMTIPICTPQPRERRQAFVLCGMQVQNDSRNTCHGKDLSKNFHSVQTNLRQIIGQKHHSARHGNDGGCTNHFLIRQTRALSEKKTVRVIQPPSMTHGSSSHTITNHGSQGWECTMIPPWKRKCRVPSRSRISGYTHAIHIPNACPNRAATSNKEHIRSSCLTDRL
mmetsp:Transcript_9741/g.17787  ORF Transcript_9741/g.17787 Transcript_9741/m.17787 type:complete len:277 (-) Transcript_9741:265-1095(-)